ncbi:MAG: hypothetical protein KI792_01575 [Alphaproteobacteria bacterium]|nr:hypothetical protein [Alphaproteobacteria bacterium SS10]
MCSLWIAAAVISALVCAVVAAPLKRQKTASMVIIATVPLAAIGIYLWAGNPDLPDQPLAGRDQGFLNQQAMMVAAAEEMAANLGNERGDAAGWALLGQAWAQLQRHRDAAAAFARAADLSGGNTALRLAQLEALIASEEGLVTPEAIDLIDDILRVEPDQQGARFYAGLALWQAGKLDAARERWEALLAEANGDEPWLPGLRDRLGTTDQ